MTSAKLDKLFTKAFKMLSYRPRSQNEVETRLKQAYFDQKDIKQVISKLKSENLINDQEFVDWWIDQRSRFKPKGSIALRQELFKKGIDFSLIDSSLPTFTQELSLAKKALNTKNYQDKTKAYQFLASRGFTSSSIRQAIDDVLAKE